ncbi:MAG: Uma2 family endonuclease [Ktedonobacteraceae bacterium]
MTMTSDRFAVVTPANHVPGPKQGQWTYAHYAALPDDGQHYEIVHGVLFMTPAPSGAHQDTVGEIYTHLRTHVKLTGLGLVRFAPFDVELAFDMVVQPDVLVVLNTNLDKVLDSRIIGAPDLVVEVASPGTATRDRREKYDAYAMAGVPEYWIADPVAHSVEVFILEADTYYSQGVFRGKAILPSKVLPGFDVRVELFFM